MTKNYILISIRTLRKHFAYSAINIIGLGLGLGVCLLLVAWIKHELSYDTFHREADRIYRGSLEYGRGGQVARTSVSPTALLPAAKSFAEVETGVRVYNASAWNPYVVRYGDRLFEEGNFNFADSTFFDVFSYTLLKGNPSKALTQPYSVLVTESTAKKYFGDEDPIGKTLLINDTREYVVTGLLKDIPDNSIIQFDFLASFHSLGAGREEPTWWSANYQTFIVLNANSNIETLSNKLDALVKRELASELTGQGDYVHYNFMPVTDIHLYSDFDGEPVVVSDIRYVYIFSAIALLILLIACINYINLATARAIDRAKEVGIRKVVGAVRNQLFIQFLGESFVVTLLAFVLAFLLAQLALPFFNNLTGKEVNYLTFLEPSFLLYSILGLLFIALLSGAYPAWVITAFKPVSVLKGQFKFSGKGVWLRKILVVVQFSISVVLIIGTLVITSQLQFIQSKKLGYDKENTIVLPMDTKTSEVFNSLKTELLRTGSVMYAGRASESPVHIKGGYTIRGGVDNDRGMLIAGLPADEQYIPALGMEIIRGRNFTEADLERVEKDAAYGFILNESALEMLRIDIDDAIGKKVSVLSREGEVIGVVKNFHFSSLHNSIGPLVIFPESWQFNKIFVKIVPGDLTASLEKIKDAYLQIAPHRPFEFEFIDEQYTALYDAEQRMGSVFTVFATLAIIIACLGLLGLVSFAAAQRTKEIGIRKALGATASHIVVLITKDFTNLMIIAIVIGLPAAYWIMEQWLNDFAYKISIGAQPLVLASLICILIAFGTASYQAIKAALINPAETLRNE